MLWIISIGFVLCMVINISSNEECVKKVEKLVVHQEQKKNLSYRLISEILPYCWLN